MYTVLFVIQFLLFTFVFTTLCLYCCRLLIIIKSVRPTILGLPFPRTPYNILVVCQDFPPLLATFFILHYLLILMLQLFMFSRVTRVCTIIAHMRVNLAILCVFESIFSHMFSFVNSFFCQNLSFGIFKWTHA